MNQRIQLLAVFGTLLFLLGCGEDIIETVDSSVQRNIDIGVINDYITEKGYTFESGDTTTNGVRYVVLNEGPGATLNYGDIVDVHFAMRLTDGELLVTTIDTMDINNDTFDSTRTYGPIRFTHSETGWAMRSKLQGLSTAYTNGFFEGVTAVLDEMNIGGAGEIMVPSDLAFGNNSFSEFRNTVIIYQIYPVYKR